MKYWYVISVLFKGVLKIVKMVKKCCSVVLIVSLLSITLLCQGQVFSNLYNYLASPPGKYHVGFQNFHWINGDACPNKFLKFVKKKYFSNGNIHHCNEMNVRIFYPTNEVGLSYYQPISELKKTIESYRKNTKSKNINFNDVKSYSLHNAEVAKGNFPVVIFSSGYGVAPEEYENIITSLVSYGFIVVGINSEFINGAFQLDQKRIIETFLPTTNQQKKDLFIVSLEDITYVYNRIKSAKIKKSILCSMNIKKIGLLGHSLGSAAVAHLAEKKNVQAVATLDLAWDNIYPNDCHRHFKAPFKELFSSFIYLSNKSRSFPYLCKKDTLRKNKSVFVLLSKAYPKEKNYSVHMSFTDRATLKYQPYMEKIMGIANSDSSKRFTGLGNGWDITNSVNIHLLVFFKKYLEN